MRRDPAGSVGTSPALRAPSGYRQSRTVPDKGVPSAISLEGEVVQILAQGGVSSLRLVLRHLTVFDLSCGALTDLHLGDRIAIDGTLRVDAVRWLPEEDPVVRPASTGRATDK